MRDPSGKIGFAILLVIALLALIGPYVVHWSPDAIDPNHPLQGPDAQHLFGTDENGRDQLARVIAAIPVALGMTLASSCIALVVGGTLGVVAAFGGGVVERLLMWMTDLFLAMPPLLMAIVVAGIFGAGERNTIIAISLIYIPRFVRVARASTLSLRRCPFIEAARLAGTRPVRIVLRHSIPAIIPELIVLTTLTLSTALLALSALSFLGLGLRPPAADLGSMLASSVPLIPIAPWLVIFPSIMLVVLIFGFNLFGDAIGNAVDPRMRHDRIRAGI